MKGNANKELGDGAGKLGGPDNEASSGGADKADRADDADVSTERADDDVDTLGLPRNDGPRAVGVRPDAEETVGGVSALAAPSRHGTPMRIANLSSLPPGAYRIYGPDYDPNAAAASVAADATRDNENDVDNAGHDLETMVFEGYVVEPTPQEVEEERVRREVQQMMASAITLDDTAVRTIHDSSSHRVAGAEARDGGGGVSARADGNDAVREDDGKKASNGLVECMRGSPFAIIGIALLVLFAAVALAVGFGGAGGNESSSSVCNGPASVEGDVDVRYERAEAIVSEISSADTLKNASSPQSQALQWIVCEDAISSKLLERRDATTNRLPKQTNGFKHGGDSGEAQVLRRYILATFFYATSEDGPWKERWNFLSPKSHECSWHQNKTRQNWPYGDFDPAGVVCYREDAIVPDDASPDAIEIVLDDASTLVGGMRLNFRIPNNLTGTIPPEFGYLEDMDDIMFENQKELRGSIPSTIGLMVHLQSFSVVMCGPDFGGVIPPSLFAIPSLEYIAIQFNDGVWELPASIDGNELESNLRGISMRYTGLSGSIPSFFTQLKKLRQLDIEGNLIDGSLPDSWGSRTNLEFFNVRDNKLTGILPQSLGQLTNLTALAFGENGFVGAIPPSLGNLKGLRLLDLGYNSLEGPIPSSFSGLKNLEHISLQHNYHLNGTISALESIRGLKSLFLYNNSFSSTIPAGLFSSFGESKEGSSLGKSSIFADFGHNSFSGKLPDAFSRHANETVYLATMKNSFDADAVGNAVCDGVRILFADCASCPCCEYCCSAEDDQLCNFDLDFYQLTGLNCGAWWIDCHKSSNYDPLPVD